MILIKKQNKFSFRLIEKESKFFKKLPAQILFEEWGTSGRIRPTLSHLLQLLIKVQLFRAADYVAVTLLRGKINYICELEPKPNIIKKKYIF